VQKNRSHDIRPFLLLDSTEESLEDFHRVDPSLPTFAHRIITGYRPHTRPAAWDAVRPFVISCVLAMQPRTHENTRRLMTITALYTTWVWTVTGVELEPNHVFTNGLLSRYLSDNLAHHSDIYRFDTTRQISTMAARLGRADIDRLPTPSQSERVTPHSASEIATINSWAATLPTEMTRRNGRALLSLAGGAGLPAAELMCVRVEDLDNLGDRMVVNVHGERARRVPVLDHWARILRKSVDGRTEGPLFKGYRLDEYPPRALQTFISEYPCTVRPSAARLHSAWVVDHLNANIPLAVLMEIGGFSSAQSVQPYLSHSRPQTSAEYFGIGASAKAVR
jgi:hypothetical protein